MTMTPFLQLLDPAVRPDPYPIYRRILQEAPVSEGPFDSVVLSRYADCVAALRSPSTSTDERLARRAQAAPAKPAGQEEEEGRPLLFRDPPDHTRLRRLVTKAFTPAAVERLKPRIQTLIDDLLDRGAVDGRIELVADFAFSLPATVICWLLGVPSGDHPRFREWSRAMARSLDPPEVLPESVLAEAYRARDECDAYLAELIARRRTDPQEDLISALITVQEAGDRLTPREMVTTCRFLLGAGHETTVNLISNGMLTLLRHPEALDRLRANPALAPNAVEEVLRFDPPVQFTRRVALADLKLGGAAVRSGQEMILLLAAANRDPECIEDPDRFDIGRPDNRHLTLGGGAHFCLGAPLARLEGALALGTLAARLVDPVLAVDPPAYKEHITLRGVEALPLEIRDLIPPRDIVGGG